MKVEYNVPSPKRWGTKTYHTVCLLGQKKHYTSTCVDPEGGGGTAGPDPPLPENHKNIGFLSETGPDPLKIHKATKPAFNVGPLSARQRNTF